MPLLALIVVLCAVLLLLVSLPVAAAVVIGAVQWAWTSGFLATLAVAALIVAVLVLLDPRERKRP